MISLSGNVIYWSTSSITGWDSQLSIMQINNLKDEDFLWQLQPPVLLSNFKKSITLNPRLGYKIHTWILHWESITNINNHKQIESRKKNTLELMRETLQQCFEATDLWRKGKRDPNKENRAHPESGSCFKWLVWSGMDPGRISIE